MASSNIKLFDENKGNMLNDTEFNISTQRLNGLQTGVASSQLQNKAMYQASLMAYAIAQLMLANGKNANDTDAVSTFVNNLLASIVQKVADKATKQDVTDGTVGKWISSELLKSNNEDIDAAKANVEDVTALGETVAALTADVGSGGHNCRIAWGTYIGNGRYGAANANSLNFGFQPVLVLIGSNEEATRDMCPSIFLRNFTKAKNEVAIEYPMTVTWTATGLSWYATGDNPNYPGWYQNNVSGRTYYYCAIGFSA